MVVDTLALVAAMSVMATVLAMLFAFYSLGSPGSAAVRGRLDGLMSGTSVIDTQPMPGALRGGKNRKVFEGLVGGNLREQLAHQLERADLSLHPTEYIILRVTFAIVGFVAPLFLMGGVEAYLVAAVGGILGYNLPKFWLNRKRKQRVDKLNAQLPEALTIISNSLKAGFGLLQALSAAGDQLEHPISTELQRTIHEMNVGSSAEVALLALSERGGSYDLDIVVTAILVQRTVGGNLGEILDTVAHTMRERIRIRGEIQTLTAQQKLTGIVIGLLPLVVAGLFQLMSPGYMDPLFTTTMGKVMVGAAVVMEVIGVLVIQRILQIEV
jgi:tight adherence protein B